MRWLQQHDAELCLSTVVIAELAFGIARIRPAERSVKLQQGLYEWRRRFAGRIFAFTEDAALAYGELMGTASRNGHPMSAPDGMIAAIAQIHQTPLATRNVADFATTGIEVIDPWSG